MTTQETDKDFIERLGNELRLPMYFGVDRSEHKRLVALASRAVEKPAGAGGWHFDMEKAPKDGQPLWPLCDGVVSDGSFNCFGKPPYWRSYNSSIGEQINPSAWQKITPPAEPGTTAPSSPVTEADEILRDLVAANDAPRVMPPAPDSAYWEQLEIAWSRARAYVSKGGV